MREELESIVGAGGVDERPIHDLWPEAIVRERIIAGDPKARAGVARALVVRPPDRERLGAVLAWALRTRTMVTPLGGGTGVCGAIGPWAGDLVVDMGAFDRILELDEANLICRCEAGVNGMELERQLNLRGLTLGHYPSSLPGTTVGGLVSTRSSGQESSRFGSIEDMVISLGVLLPGGTYAAPRPGPRSAVGPALHELFLGAEGGLGLVVEAVLRIHRIPPATLGQGFAFPDVRAGLECMRQVMQAGIRPRVMRLYDQDDSAFNGYDVENGECVLVVATAGLAEVALAEAGAVREFAAGARPLGEQAWERWLEHRFDLSAERLRAMLEAPGSYLDTIELAAPWTVLGELHARVKSAIASGALALCHFSHAYEQGCCAYFTFAGHADSESGAREAYSRAWESAMAVALELGATISHHHGVGQVRSAWVAGEMGGWMEVWRAVRSALDPESIMNRQAVGGNR